jgi:hypothetical protein
MKNTDIAMVIFVAGISVVVSHLLGNAILGDPNNNVETIDFMTPISSTVELPDAESFNSESKNPTVEVLVGNCGVFEIWDSALRECVLRDEYKEKKDESSDKEDSDNEDDSDDSGLFRSTGEE